MDSLAAVDWTAYEQEAQAGDRRGALGERARRRARQVPRAQVGARPGAARRARPRERDAPERDPGPARGGGGRARAGPAAAGVRVGRRLRPRRDDPRPPGPPRAAAPADADQARDRGHLPRHGLRGLGRRRGRDRLGELRRADERRRPSVALAVRHLLPRRGHRAADAHVARPDPRDAAADAADLHGLARPLLPARHARRNPFADLPAGRVPRRRSRDHARRPAGDGAAVLPRAVRPGARGADADELLPLHRAVGGVRRHLLHLRRPGLRDVQALGLDRDGRRGLGRPRRVPQRRPRPRRSGRDSRSASGSSGSPCSGTACPTCARSGRTIFESWGSSDEGPRLLAARVRRLRPAGRGARAAARLHELRGRSDRPARRARRRQPAVLPSSARCSRPASIRTPTSCS